MSKYEKLTKKQLISKLEKIESYVAELSFENVEETAKRYCAERPTDSLFPYMCGIYKAFVGFMKEVLEEK